MDLHYSQTLSSKTILRSLFYYLIDLHYSQTAKGTSGVGFWFHYLMDLHYSQTTASILNGQVSFTTL